MVLGKGFRQIWAEVRVQAGRWWWSWVVVGNWRWMVGGSRWFVVDSVWVISFIEVLIRRAQKSLEIRAKYVARKIARFDAGAIVFANALTVVAGVGAVSIGGFGVVVVVIVVDQLMSNLGLRAWLKSDNERSRFL